MLNDEFTAAADDWLAATGELVNYRSGETGLVSSIYATVEMDQTTVTEHGMTSDGHVVTIRSSLVEAKRGDQIDFPSASYRVDELFDNPGVLQRLFVSKL